ncbi:MAG: hypothetical protein JHC30_07600 [Caldisericum sp.]|nr:hypothetical protein [Caldisericum sp.]
MSSKGKSKDDYELKSFSELRAELKREALKDKLKFDTFVDEVVDQKLILSNIDILDEGVILYCRKIPDDGKLLRVFSNSKVIRKQIPMIQKALDKYKEIIITVKKVQSKMGKTYYQIF